MSNSYKTLEIQIIDKHIFVITLNRPDKLNALNEDVLRELSDAFNTVKNNAAIQGLIITGHGKAFCAGADISRIAELTATQGVKFAEQGQSVFRQLETLGKPSIAAINGYALGGGCELAMAASMRIASEKAVFGQPEVRLGVIPGYGGTQRLARLVGKGRAIDLCISGRQIKAEQAMQWGLATHLVNPDELMKHATETLKSILSMGPVAVKSVLEVMNAGYELSLEEAFHLEALHFGITCSTRDKHEGVNAFLEKRSPSFTGE